MMAQVHMSYVIWNDLTSQTMPSIVRVGADTPESKRRQRPVFVRSPAPQAGIVAIEAPAFTRARDSKGLRWTTIPYLGRTAGAVIAMPQGKPATRAEDGVCLEYDVAVRKTGPATLTLYLVPTLDTVGHDGSRIGVSIDGGAVQVLRAVLEPTGGDTDNAAKTRWADAVRDNGVQLSASLGTIGAGRHVIKIWRLDDNMVLQKLVLATVPLAVSYLGPVSDV